MKTKTIQLNINLFDEVVYPIVKPYLILKQLLKEENISVYKLATETNIQAPYLYNILKGQIKISQAISKRLAKYFKVSDNFFYKQEQLYSLKELVEKIKTL